MEKIAGIEQFLLFHLLFLKSSATAISDWSLQHPQNWNASAVEAWINFVAEKYHFPVDIRRKCVSRMRGVTGKRLIAMEQADFQHSFKEIGELVYIAFIQIMDVGPDFEERSKIYTEKISSILDVLIQADKVIKRPLWTNIPVSQWTSAEVNQWIISLVEETSGLESARDRLVEAFEGVDGQQLCTMSADDVGRLARDLKAVVLESLQTLKMKDVQVDKSSNLSPSDGTHTERSEHLAGQQ